MTTIILALPALVVAFTGTIYPLVHGDLTVIQRILVARIRELVSVIVSDEPAASVVDSLTIVPPLEFIVTADELTVPAKVSTSNPLT